jgi:hypothetical protein
LHNRTAYVSATKTLSNGLELSLQVDFVKLGQDFASHSIGLEAARPYGLVEPLLKSLLLGEMCRDLDALGHVILSLLPITPKLGLIRVDLLNGSLQTCDDGLVI